MLYTGSSAYGKIRKEKDIVNEHAAHVATTAKAVEVSGTSLLVYLASGREGTIAIYYKLSCELGFLFTYVDRSVNRCALRGLILNRNSCANLYHAARHGIEGREVGHDEPSKTE